MSRTISIAAGVLVFGAALVYALWLIAGRRAVSPGEIAAAGRVRKIFLTTVVAILSMAGVSGCKNGDKDTGGDIPRTTAVRDGGAVAPASVKEKTAWIALGDKWEVLASLATADAWKDMDKSLADSQRQEAEQAALVDKLVAAGELDKQEGDGLKAVYSEIMSHLQRSYAGPTCYEMTVGGAFVQSVKGGTAMRLASLKKFIDDGTLKGGAADKIKASIARDLHFLEKLEAMDKEFSGGGKWEQWEKKMTELQKLYENTKHVIAGSDPSHELAGIIIKMMKLSAEND
ncbi:MAG: hypothetical protein ABIJ56_23095 [Pseudomonadota bacterium]